MSAWLFECVAALPFVAAASIASYLRWRREHERRERLAHIERFSRGHTFVWSPEFGPHACECVTCGWTARYEKDAVPTMRSCAEYVADCKRQGFSIPSSAHWKKQAIVRKLDGSLYKEAGEGPVPAESPVQGGSSMKTLVQLVVASAIAAVVSGFLARPKAPEAVEFDKSRDAIYLESYRASHPRCDEAGHELEMMGDGWFKESLRCKRCGARR